MGGNNSLSGVTLDTLLTWSFHIDQVRKRTVQRMGMLGPLMYRKSDLSVRNGVLLCKYGIRPLMEYACSAWRSNARSQTRRLQVLQSMCLRLDTDAPWYVSNLGSGRSVVCRPHQSLDREFWLKVSCCGEPPTTATRQTLTLTEG